MLLKKLLKIAFVGALAFLESQAMAARQDFVGTWIKENNNAPLSVLTVDSNFFAKIDSMSSARLFTYGTVAQGSNPEQHTHGSIQFSYNGHNYIGILMLGGLFNNGDKNMIGLLFYDRMDSASNAGNVGQYIVFKRRLIIVDPKLPDFPGTGTIHRP